MTHFLVGYNRVGYFEPLFSDALDPPHGHSSKWVQIIRRICLQSHLQTSLQTPKNSYAKFPKPLKPLKEQKHINKSPQTARGEGSKLKLGVHMEPCH
jgi:hypothetical protein